MKYLLGILLSSMTCQAQVVKNDTVVIQKQEAASSAFVDASSDSRPREISLGLPTNVSNVVYIYEDGLPVSYYLYQLYPYKSWHGGVSQGKGGTMNPMEAAMRQGEIGYYVDSYNRTGSDAFQGKLNYSVNQYGQHKVDVNIAGPISRGWAYSLSTYQNFDRGSNHLELNYLMDRHQFYKGVLSKEFGNGRGNMAFVYQYVNYLSLRENFGPFIFMNDGSVKPYPGFNLGHDSYLPSTSTFDLVDFKTGREFHNNYLDGNTDKIHHATFHLDYDFLNGNHLTVRSRFKTGHSYRAGRTLTGIDNVTEDHGYTYADGTPFQGNLQRRILLHFDAFETTWMNNAELKGHKDNHSWRVGADYAFNHGGTITSSGMTAHPIAVNPEQLYLNGQAYFDFNTNGEYYDGYEHKIALYAKDEWKVNRRLDLEGFIRLENLNIHGEAANNTDDFKGNTRKSGFNLTQGRLTDFKENFLNGAFGLSGNYKITNGLSGIAELTVTRSHTNLFNYGGATLPSTDPSDTKLVRAGLSYRNSWVNVISQMVYITKNNMNSRASFQHVLQHPVGDFPIGYTETLPQHAVYGIASLGWTTDAVLTPAKGFNLHLLLTLRNPQYKDFRFDPTFSDGVTEHYDFTNNNVTNLHKVEISVDPSYTWGAWRVWLQARYISKQYINKTNSLYFKGRFETFGGVDYKLNKYVDLNLNIINLLNQKGASGAISSADLVEDASKYDNYLMSGTFIRPFTVEVGAKISF